MESNLRHKQREEQEAVASSSQASGSVEFATAEETIHADREQVLPPPEIAERLNESIAAEPKPARSFWTKLGFKK